MPDVGFDDTPTIPTMRDATATNIRPKIATPAAQMARASGPMFPANTPGTRAAIRTTATMAPATNDPGRSRSVAGVLACEAPPLVPRLRATDANALTMVGMFFATVMMPAVATAPAPMYRT